MINTVNRTIPDLQSEITELYGKLSHVDFELSQSYFQENDLLHRQRFDILDDIDQAEKLVMKLNDRRVE